jgi:hypothetical protein
MKTERMTAFTDGVVAIIITIMVLELKVPESAEPHALLATLPILAAYLLSYINVGLYRNNHHHLLQSGEHIDGRALWANLMLLFWLSLVPFVIRWAPSWCLLVASSTGCPEISGSRKLRVPARGRSAAGIRQHHVTYRPFGRVIRERAGAARPDSDAFSSSSVSGALISASRRSQIPSRGKCARLLEEKGDGRI